MFLPLFFCFDQKHDRAVSVVFVEVATERHICAVLSFHRDGNAELPGLSVEDIPVRVRDEPTSWMRDVREVAEYYAQYDKPTDFNVGMVVEGNTSQIWKLLQRVNSLFGFSGPHYDTPSSFRIAFLMSARRLPHSVFMRVYDCSWSIFSTDSITKMSSIRN